MITPWTFFGIVLFSVCFGTVMAGRRLDSEDSSATRVRAERIGGWLDGRGLDSLEKRLWACALTFGYLFDRAFLGRQSVFQQTLWIWMIATLFMLPFDGFANQVSTIFELDGARFSDVGIMVFTPAVGSSVSIGMAIGRIGSRAPVSLMFSLAVVAAFVVGFAAVLGVDLAGIDSRPISVIV